MKPKNISEYISSYPKETQKRLRKFLGAVRKAAPKAKEGLKWGMPAFSYKRILVIFGGFKHHIGFYPTTSATRAFANQLGKYKTAPGSVQFPLNQPLPLSLIGKITKFRVKESIEQDGKWRT